MDWEDYLNEAEKVYQECLSRAQAMPGLKENVQSQVRVAGDLFRHVMGQYQPPIVLQDRARPGRDGAPKLRRAT